MAILPFGKIFQRLTNPPIAKISIKFFIILNAMLVESFSSQPIVLGPGDEGFD